APAAGGCGTTSTTDQALPSWSVFCHEFDTGSFRGPTLPMNAFHWLKRFALFPGATFAALVAVQAAIHAQEPLTPVQTDRLMAFGQLWGFIKFSHPWLAHRGTEWDQAFVQTVPAVISSQSPEQYRQALEQLISALNDRATCIVSDDAT